MSQERREYERVPAYDGDVLHPDFNCVDFSEIGMRFSAPRPVARGDTFRAEVTAFSAPTTLHCRVVWCRELVPAIGEHSFQFGVTFDCFSMGKQLLLRELISDRTSQSQTFAGTAR